MADAVPDFYEIVGTEVSESQNRTLPADGGCSPGIFPSDPARQLLAGALSQWAVLPNDGFMACPATSTSLPSAVYDLDRDPHCGQPVFKTLRSKTDDLWVLPGSVNETVLSGIQGFWDSKGKYDHHGLSYKRGLLLWGPAGSGKTVTVLLLCEELIRRGGVVLIAREPNLVTDALAHLRRVEPDRNLVVVLEDLDALVERFGEAQLLTVLDGEHQTNRICFLATTNYPERLDERVVNRPSRFDEVIYVGMPSPEARTEYLRKRGVVPGVLKQWVADTEGLSIAHLRELVAAVHCLGRPYDATLTRLKSMRRKPKSSDGLGTAGFGSGK